MSILLTLAAGAQLNVIYLNFFYELLKSSKLLFVRTNAFGIP